MKPRWQGSLPSVASTASSHSSHSIFLCSLGWSGRESLTWAWSTSGGEMHFLAFLNIHVCPHRFFSGGLLFPCVLIELKFASKSCCWHVCSHIIIFLSDCISSWIMKAKEGFFLWLVCSFLLLFSEAYSKKTRCYNCGANIYPPHTLQNKVLK